MPSRRISLCSLLAALIPSVVAAEDVAELIKRLEAGQPKAARTEAAVKLRELKGPEALKAVPALTRLVEDKDAVVRAEGVAALATIAFLNKQPCPVAVVKALFDPDTDVRSTANTYVGAFDKYPEEARALFLRALEHDDVNVRSSASGPLAQAWGKEKEVLAALKKATKDKSLLVRNNAHAALWPLTRDLDFLLPHLLQASDAAVNSPQEEARTEEEKRERLTANLIAIGSATRFVVLTAERPEELARALLKRLTDPSPVIRRAAARTLAAMSVEVKETPLDSRTSPPEFKLPRVDHQKVKGILKDLKVEAAIRKLLTDSDASVRDSAAVALQRLTGDKD